MYNMVSVSVSRRIKEISNHLKVLGELKGILVNNFICARLETFFNFIPDIFCDLANPLVSETKYVADFLDLYSSPHKTEYILFMWRQH